MFRNKGHSQSVTKKKKVTGEDIQDYTDHYLLAWDLPGRIDDLSSPSLPLSLSDFLSLSLS